jgi:hypothetical protein
VNKQEKLQNESIIDYLDSTVANTINSASTAIEISSSAISQGIKMSGSIANQTLDSANDNIIKQMPNIVDIKVLSIVKQSVKQTVTISNYGKTITNQTASSAQYIGKSVGNMIGTTLKSKLFKPSESIESSKPKIKSLEALKKFANTTTNAMTDVLNTVDQTTDEISEKVGDVVNKQLQKF